MKLFSICIETGPCAGDCYYVNVEALTLEDAIRIAGEQARKERPWQHIMIIQAACEQIE